MLVDNRNVSKNANSKGHDDNVDDNARRTNKCRLADSKYTLLATEARPNNAGRYVTVEISF